MFWVIPPLNDSMDKRTPSAGDAHSRHASPHPLEFRDSDEESIDSPVNDAARPGSRFDDDADLARNSREARISGPIRSSPTPPQRSPITSPRGLYPPTAPSHASHLPPLSHAPTSHSQDHHIHSQDDHDYHSHRQASCSTFFLGDENQTTIDVTWMGESLGLELQRIKSSKLPVVDLVWNETMPSVGVTFGIEQITRQVVVKRTTRHDVVPGYILASANGHRVVEHNFDATMKELKAGHGSGRSQLLQFIPPPAAPLIKSVDPRGVLGRAGLTHAYELKSVNGLQTRYQSLDQISIALRDAVKPCLLHFALSDDAQELMQLQETVAAARNQSGASLAAAAIIAAVCI